MRKPSPPPGSLSGERLRTAIHAANLPTLTMVLFQLTGDERWLRDPYRPVRSRGLGPNDSGGFPAEVANEIKAAAFDAITAWAQGVPPAEPVPSRDLLREMLSATVAEDVPEEYERLMREEMGFGPGSHPAMSPAAAAAARDFTVVIIGAGISGLIAGVRLRELGIPFVILERNNDVGGVWLTNTYPGAGVDTPSYLYSFSFFPRNWSTHFGKRDEVAAYISEMSEHFDLRRQVTFGVEVISAAYAEDEQRWTVVARDPDGTEYQYTANALISAVGLFNKPKLPDIPGTDAFSGPLFHTANWPQGLDVTGQRVAVVGTGASAMQVVPAIADRVAQLVIFQRSPQWVAPDDEYFRPIGGDVHWLMENVPFYHTWYRFRLAWVFNDRVFASLQVDEAWQHPERSLNAVNDGHRRYFARYLRDELAGRPDLIEKCLPTYPPFGKRMLLDNGWYKTLKRPNVELVTDTVNRVTETGIVTDAGQAFNADIIVMSTGFDAQHYVQPMLVTGRAGQSLNDVWDDDNPSAYLGITVPGFPNFFLMYGPNTNVGAGGSFIFIAECQGRYIADLVASALDRGLGSVECRSDVHARWVKEVDTLHARMVWSHPGMSTYYRNSRGRVVTNLPYRVVDYWSLTREAQLDDFLVEPIRSS